eukprot:GDKI01047051.1.p1 GENE.GDKI01047051.1~~GDKI01047051.1.p1  ORF type:complete len:300 (+),score=68.81 GDKI01047051.1:83-901(+)
MYGNVLCPKNKVQDCKDVHHNDDLCKNSFYLVTHNRGFFCSPCRGDPDVSCCSSGHWCATLDSSLTVRNEKCDHGHHGCQKSGDKCLTGDGRTHGTCKVTGKNTLGNVCACVESPTDTSQAETAKLSAVEEKRKCDSGYNGCAFLGDSCELKGAEGRCIEGFGTINDHVICECSKDQVEWQDQDDTNQDEWQEEDERGMEQRLESGEPCAETRNFDGTCHHEGQWCCTSPGNMMTQGRCTVTGKNETGGNVCTCIQDQDERHRGGVSEMVVQ